jgi:hypothetical protein
VARSDAATGGTRRFPPLPPTLVLEGAAQPFLFEMVASQALHARLPSDPVIAGQSTTGSGRYDGLRGLRPTAGVPQRHAFEPGRVALVGGACSTRADR